MELGPLGLDRENQDKKNQNYCASDAPSLGISHVSKTYGHYAERNLSTIQEPCAPL